MREYLLHSAHELGLSITDEQVAQFMGYISHLLEWNRVTNLTSITDPREIVTKHFIDSLAALASVGFPPQAAVLDVGSGAGFPGIPLKIVRSDIQLILVEPNQKKCSFLSSAVGLLKLKHVSIFAGTLQQYVAQAMYLTADIMVVRALRFDEIKQWAMKVLKKDGKVVLYRTVKMELGETPSGLIIETERSFSLPLSHDNRVISVMARSVPL